MSRKLRAVILQRVIFVFGLLGCGIGAQSATTFWAGTTAGLLKSADGGVSWQPVPVTVSNSLLQGNLGISAIALDPQQPGTIYLVGNANGTGFFRSNDTGNTWTGITLIGINQGVGNTWLAVDPVLTNIIYLGSAGELHKSADFGNTWTQVATPAGVGGLSVDPSVSGTVYLSNNNAVYRSTDYGTTWTPLTKVLQAADVPAVGNVIVDPNNSNTLYVGDDYPFVNGSCGTVVVNQSCGLFKSTNAGQSWTNIAPAGIYTAVVFDSQNSNLYAGATVSGVGGGVVKSTDGGNTWVPVNNTVGRVSLLADPGAANTLVAFNPYGQEAEVFRSTDAGTTWVQTNLKAVPLVTGGTAFPNVNCMAVARPVGTVTSTSFLSGPVAPESIVSALGFDLATEPQIGPFPPTISLNGTTVSVVDSTGTSRPALLFYVSATEVNFEIPAGTALGTALVVITSGDGVVSKSVVGVVPVTPGFYELNSAGLAAAYALRATGDVHTYQNVWQLGNSNNVIALPIDLNPSTDQIYLELYGTGLRGGSSPTATLGNVSLPVLYAGAQGQYPGEDQVDVGPIPLSLMGAGNLPLVFTTNGIAANTVNVSIK